VCPAVSIPEFITTAHLFDLCPYFAAVPRPHSVSPILASPLVFLLSSIPEVTKDRTTPVGRDVSPALLRQTF